jgi:phosphatidylinositol-3-phosphatase
MRPVGGLALACVLALAASGCSSASSPAARPATTASKTATVSKAALAPTRPGAVTKVLVFVEENHSLSQMRSGMPYTYGLAQRFGYATHYTAIQHPSLPNYIAIAGGQTYGITDDRGPTNNPVGGRSVFGQAAASDKSAAVYAEAMPQPCATSDAGSSSGSGYAVRHNPWAYFYQEQALCQKYDVPIDQLGGAITNGTLPNVGMVVPDLCNDAHSCPLGTADSWFKGWMTQVLKGPDWQSGHLAVVLTADEDDSSQANTVLTVVVHPSQKAHVVTTALTHYSLTRLFEEVAGLPYLFGASSAPSMTTAFGLPLS